MNGNDLRRGTVTLTHLRKRISVERWSMLFDDTTCLNAIYTNKVIKCMSILLCRFVVLRFRSIRSVAFEAAHSEVKLCHIVAYVVVLLRNCCSLVCRLFFVLHVLSSHFFLGACVNLVSIIQFEHRVCLLILWSSFSWFISYFWHCQSWISWFLIWINVEKGDEGVKSNRRRHTCYFSPSRGVRISCHMC